MKENRAMLRVLRVITAELFVKVVAFRVIVVALRAMTFAVCDILVEIRVIAVAYM